MKFTKKLWGEHCDKDVFLFELEHEGGMRACVSNYGGILQSLWVKNARGEDMDVVLGYDTLAEYISSETFFGAMVGPIADRLGEGRLQVNGQAVQFPLNAGPDCMHSGPNGFHGRVWNWEMLDDGIAFSLRFGPENKELPGTLDVRLAYRICANSSLRIEYGARCDCETVLSFTNHSYFTLNGGRENCADHLIRLNADVYAETCREVEPICTGRSLPVDGTPMDMRVWRRLDDVLACTDFPEIRTGVGIDHYFPVRGEGMREHGRLRCEENGLELTCRSDAPGVLVYSANGLEAEPGKGCAVYGRNWAVCLETERHPNAANFPHLRSQVLLKPGEQYFSATEFVLTHI